MGVHVVRLACGRDGIEMPCGAARLTRQACLSNVPISSALPAAQHPHQTQHTDQACLLVNAPVCITVPTISCTHQARLLVERAGQQHGRLLGVPRDRLHLAAVVPQRVLALLRGHVPDLHRVVGCRGENKCGMGWGGELAKKATHSQ